MTGTSLENCGHCGAVLAPWETRCACKGPRNLTIREILYSVACTAPQVLHARDFVRIAEHDYGFPFSMSTALVYLSGDYRFCWAGRGLYGLYRHGPLPGPRALEAATRLVLVAADRPLAQDVVDFCLKQFGYRYNVASLNNAVVNSDRVFRYGGFWDYRATDDAPLLGINDIPVVPANDIGSWTRLRTDIRINVARSSGQLKSRLEAVTQLNRFSLDWEQGDMT